MSYHGAAGPASGPGVDSVVGNYNCMEYLMQWYQRFLRNRLPITPVVSTTFIFALVSYDKRPDGAGDFGYCPKAAAPHIFMALAACNKKRQWQKFPAVLVAPTSCHTFP